MQYEDDHYHPNNDSDDSICYQELDDSATYASYGTSMNVNHHQTVKQKNQQQHQQQQTYMKFKMLDKGYRQLLRYHNGEKVAVELYVTSCVPGGLIRDAVTGSRYNKRVGTKDEDAFFKVKDVSGAIGREPGNLYFETPKQADKYLNVVFSEKAKAKWNAKYEAYCEKQETMSQ